MRHILGLALLVSTATLPVAAQAGTKDVLQPVQLGNESVRFDHGDFLIDLPGQHAAVQLKPLPSDHDYMSFQVIVLNAGAAPINLDVTDIRIEGTKDPVRVLSRAEMQQKAERRAGWAKVLTSVGGVLVAASENNQRNTYHATTVTPYGVFSTHISAPCWSCRAAANDTLAATNYRVAQIQNALDQTRGALGEQMLQLTTVDPGRSYGGRIFLSKFNHDPNSAMRLVVTVGGESFTFGFRFAPVGTPMPAYRMAAVAPMSLAPAHQAVSYAPYPSQAVYTPPSDQRAPVAPMPVAAPFVPTRAAFVPTPAPASSAQSANWHRYYDAAVAVGVAKSQAKLMADEHFGPLD